MNKKGGYDFDPMPRPRMLTFKERQQQEALQKAREQQEERERQAREAQEEQERQAQEREEARQAQEREEARQAQEREEARQAQAREEARQAQAREEARQAQEREEARQARIEEERIKEEEARKAQIEEARQKEEKARIEEARQNGVSITGANLGFNSTGYTFNPAGLQTSTTNDTKTLDQLRKEFKQKKIEFETAQKKYIEDKLSKILDYDEKLNETTKLIKQFNSGKTKDDDIDKLVKEYKELEQKIKTKESEEKEKKITEKKNKELKELYEKYNKIYIEASRLYMSDEDGLKQKNEEIQKNYDIDKDAIENKYDPINSQEKKSNSSNIKNLSLVKQIKIKHLEDFKSGNYETVNQKYKEKGLEENKELNNYINKTILSDDKIDRRKAIEILKIKMNEIGIVDEQQILYIQIIKEFKDDFNIRLFEDDLTGVYPTKDSDLAELIINFQNIVKKNAKGRPLNLIEKDLFDNAINKIDEIKKEIKKDPTRPQGDDIDALKKYINSIKSTVEIKNEDVMQTTKNIIDFKQIASYFSFLIKFLATICIIIYIIVLFISFFNVINLIIKICTNIVTIFYNKVIANNQIISYEAKDITKCTKSNYKDDIFNILNEQFTSLAVFNAIIYIIYILLGYVIIFLLSVIFVNIYRYTHVLNGDLKDIDPKYQLMSVLIIIFVTSFIHLLIYKFFFRQLTITKYKDIVIYETNVDNIIRKNLQPENKINDEDFFDLLADSTRRSEIDTIFANKVNDMNEPNSDLSKYLFMYDIYMYFDEYAFTNDIVRDDLKNYLKIGDKTDSTRTFISFLDANERKLIKLYHEELPFYKDIPKEKLERFQKLNEKISQDIAILNKNIIKYTGTFYPFLFACIYIFGIFLFNVLCTYILMDYILTTEKDELFMPFIYMIARKYKSVIMYFSNYFKN
jgi:hypothetical protein